MSKKPNMLKFLWIGFKLFLVMLIAGVIMGIGYGASLLISLIFATISVTLGAIISMIVMILIVLIGWTLEGYLLYRFKEWILR